MKAEYKKLGTTTKTSKISLNIFDDKRFYVNNIKSYPHDKELYLFKRDLINRIREAASPIKKLYKDKDKDVDKLICEQTVCGKPSRFHD